MLCLSQLLFFPPNCLNLASYKPIQNSTALAKMASTTPKPVQKLGELLQEQQEPFLLDVYLLERGCSKKSLNSEGSFGCCHGNSTKFLNRSASCGIYKSRKCSKILGAICKRLVSSNEKPTIKHSNNGDGKESVTEKRSRNRQDVAVADRYSSASSTTVFYSCSDSDPEETSTSTTAVSFQDLKLGNLREKES